VRYFGTYAGVAAKLFKQKTSSTLEAELHVAQQAG